MGKIAKTVKSVLDSFGVEASFVDGGSNCRYEFANVMDLVLQECIYADHDDYETRNEVVVGFNDARELVVLWRVEYYDDQHKRRIATKSRASLSRDEAFRLSKHLQISVSQIPLHLVSLFSVSLDGYLTSYQVRQLYEEVIRYLSSFGILVNQYH